MLRALLVLLLLANAGWWTWTQGWLPAGALPWPLDSQGQREPQRLAAQVRPESIQVLPSAEALRLQAAACLQAGPYGDAAWAAAAAVVARTGLAGDAWQRVPADEGSILRVPEADAGQQALLRNLQDADLGEGFKPCP